MAVVPGIESVLLEILQALDLDGLQTKAKSKFKLRQMTLSKYQETAGELFADICRELKLDIEAKEDLYCSLLEACAFHFELENSVWTFEANQHQVLWYLLGYSWVPFVARKVAFWQLDEAMDADMPGGQFWYLPQRREIDGKSEIRMPVANVLDWLFDLSDISMDKMATYLGGGFNEETGQDEDSADGIESNLYNWRKGIMPRAKKIDLIFRDTCELPFHGAFSVADHLSLDDKLNAARQFLDKKGLKAEDLTHEIPIKRDAIKAVLQGEAGPDVTSIFIDHLSQRYARPSMLVIRRRLLIARAVQHGYRKLVNAFCPKVKETCPDPSQNKALQLLNLYMHIYNVTVKAHSKCSNSVEENRYFESEVPPWYNELLHSILPSNFGRGSDTAQEVGTLLSERFYGNSKIEDLEDLFGWDHHSGQEIMDREMGRLNAKVKRAEACQKINLTITNGAPWKKLQSINDYNVIRSLLSNNRLPSQTRDLTYKRLREVALSPYQKVRAIIDELDHYLNNPDMRLTKKAYNRVEELILELKGDPNTSLVEFEYNRHKAKHALFQNDFDSTENYLLAAFNIGTDKNRGRQYGEVSRDLFALLAARNRLIPNNHEKYFRQVLFAGMFEGGMGKVPSIEEAAEVAINYFWGDYYRAYSWVKPYSR